MKEAPIIPTLELWAQGYSARDVAAMLGYPNGRQVALIVAQARSIGDKRAVYHFTRGRIIGKGVPFEKRRVRRNQKTFDGFALVPLKKAIACKRGHPRNDLTVYKDGRCKECKRLAKAGLI